MSDSGERSDVVVHVETPPRSVAATLRRLGPGLIVAASIVGSGELIATTKAGAQAGFWLLWLILVGCVIKVFVQIEFGRNAIHSGQTTMEALSEVPGPRWKGHGNWIVWYWFLMFVGSLSQLGGIVGSVGQALAISAPLTEHGRRFNRFANASIGWKSAEAALQASQNLDVTPERQERLATRARQWKAELERMSQSWREQIGDERFRELGHRPPPPIDDKIWAAIIAVATSWMLFRGRYRFIQWFSTLLVGSFTAITLINLGLLQVDPIWHVRWDDIVTGMQFRIPPGQQGSAAVMTALATFGIIGVGASELIVYPYWCLEKGYARFTGPFEDHASWYERAHGWLRVMQWDAWGSMVIYTLATVAFYLLGAAILGRSGLDPQSHELIRTLSTMYEPVFGDWATILFLFGSFAVLYSTFFVANASHARVLSDTLGVLGLAQATDAAKARRIRLLSALFPIVCLVIYVAVPRPAQLVLLGGLLQAIMLPMLAAAALFFRYVRTPIPLRPGGLWDLFLWLSALGMAIAGGAALVLKIQQLLA